MMKVGLKYVLGLISLMYVQPHNDWLCITGV
jgi:hypothetical protein